jgi:hypothetical protein
METKKPIIAQVYAEPLHQLPPEAVTRFKHQVAGGLLPSAALREFMQSYPQTDANAVIALMRLTHPDVPVSSEFTMPLHDSNYPQCREDVYSDQDFDRAVKELLSQ